MSWKNVLVVRPQPGQAVTCGVKLRSSERLQNLLADDHFVGAVAIRQRRERGADGIADAFLQQHADARRWSRRCPSIPGRLRSSPRCSA